MNPDNFCVILVEPQGPMNIGSVCRTMMNFGFSDLRLVNPCEDYQSLEARKMALKAERLIKQAGIFTSLHDALTDCTYALGTTRRFGKYRNAFLLPDQAAEMTLSFSDQCRTALVFGREDRGLHTEELDLCQYMITIPTHDDFASMNLAQSVTVCLYELNKVLKKDEGISGAGITPCDGKELEQMYMHMRQTFLDIDYSDPLSPDHILRVFRRIFGRAMLSERDVRVLQGLWSRIDWIESQRKLGLILHPEGKGE
ncbi:MAG: RNA methyltransferase [Proteobacteria bacterium]|nr:RNA methyltransferase [Pseudomonadota bacterium]